MVSRIDLKKEQLNLIFENVKDMTLKDIILKAKNDAAPEKKGISLFLSEADLEKVLDELTFAFTSKGLDANDEPNALGKELDEIIGILYNA